MCQSTVPACCIIFLVPTLVSSKSFHCNPTFSAAARWDSRHSTVPVGYGVQELDSLWCFCKLFIWLNPQSVLALLNAFLFSSSPWTYAAVLTENRILFLMTEQRCQNISVAPLGTSATSLAIFTAGHNFMLFLNARSTISGILEENNG